MRGADPLLAEAGGLELLQGVETAQPPQMHHEGIPHDRAARDLRPGTAVPDRVDVPTEVEAPVCVVAEVEREHGRSMPWSALSALSCLHEDRYNCINQCS